MPRFQAEAAVHEMATAGSPVNVAGAWWVRGRAPRACSAAARTLHAQGHTARSAPCTTPGRTPWPDAPSARSALRPASAHALTQPLPLPRHRQRSTLRNHRTEQLGPARAATRFAGAARAVVDDEARSGAPHTDPGKRFRVQHLVEKHTVGAAFADGDALAVGGRGAVLSSGSARVGQRVARCAGRLVENLGATVPADGAALV